MSSLEIFSQSNFSENLVYDDLNRLIAVQYGSTLIEYCYDNLGNRTCRIVSGGTQTTVDLTPTNGTATPTVAAPGGAIELSFLNENLGTDNSGGFASLVVLSTNGTYEPGQDQILLSFQTANLNGGAMEQETRSVTLPANTVPGSYQLLVIVDHNDQVDELSEDNNLLAIALTVQDCNSNFVLSMASNSATCGQANADIDVTPFNGSSPYSYQWSVSPSPNNGTLNGVAAGMYSVTVTDALGCVATKSIMVPSGEEVPVANFSATDNNTTASFTNTSSGGGTSYTWTFGDGQTSTASDPQHTYASVGTYTVCLSATNSCGTDQRCQGISVGLGCVVPTGLIASNITATGATVNWSGTVSSYSIRYRVGDNPNWTTVSNVSGSSYTFINLTEGLTYEFQVMAECGGMNSGWSASGFFSPTAGNSGSGTDNPNLVQTVTILENISGEPTSIAEFSNGDFLVAVNSSAIVRMSPQGDVIWAKSISMNGIGFYMTICNNEIYLLTSSAILKLSENGVGIWYKQINSGLTSKSSIACLQDNTVAIYGQTQNGSSLAVGVIKVNSQGSVLASKTYYETGSDMFSVAMDVNPATGNIGITGRFDGNNTNDEIGGRDIFFVRINPSTLNIINQGWFGSSVDDDVYDLTFRGGNIPLFVGTTQIFGSSNPFIIRGRSSNGFEEKTYIFNNNSHRLLGIENIAGGFDIGTVGWSFENSPDGDEYGVIVSTNSSGSVNSVDRIDIGNTSDQVNKIIRATDGDFVGVGFTDLPFSRALYFTKFSGPSSDFECIDDNMTASTVEQNWDSESGIFATGLSATSSDLAGYTVTNISTTLEPLCCPALANATPTQISGCENSTITLYSISTGYDSLAWTIPTTDTYLGSGTSLNYTLNNTSATQIRLTAFAGSCSSVFNIPVSVTSGPTFDLVTTPDDCGGGSGSATLQNIGASGTASINWSTGATATTLLNLSVGTYSVQVSDDSGCTVVENFMIDDPNSSVITNHQVDFYHCSDLARFATIVPSGGVSPYRIAWNGNSLSSSTSDTFYFFVASNTNYNYTIVDNAGCATDDSIKYEQATALSITTNGADNTSASSPYNGWASVSASGGTPPFSHSWSNRAETSSSIIGIESYSGAVTVTDINGCISTANIMIEDRSPILVNIRVYLEGAYDTNDGLMRDELRTLSHIPTSEPYTTIGYQHQGDQGGCELISDSTNVLSDRGPNSVVDWVLIELRDQSDISVILHSRAALLLRNGNITDMDGVSPVGFSGVNSDSYFIAIRHRNHLAVATKNPTNLSVGTTNTVDFTNPSTLTYGTSAQVQLSSGSMAMVSGDANGDGSVNAVDKNTHWRPQNGQSFNYLSSKADFNLDGAVNAIDQNLHWRINNSKTQNF